ncbi:3D domain-containing protein [Virgibacillus pantothenticus]|uniref:3D domain-containing protein n=1 Tax=Virgibacillus pantothenticus TaxID=1473 RepID=UPI0024B3A51E|nr:3D domain-containing protein [Virgibacillus pantothenticus]
MRIIAVDPAVIPLGTRVKVTLADGSSFVATASDTGGDIKGRRIDVLVANKAEARRLGRQKAEVEVIK